MRILVDATTLIALGQIGELDLLSCLRGDLVVPEPVKSEVSTEPARTNLENLADRTRQCEWDWPAQRNMLVARAKQVLDEDSENGDVVIIASVLRTTDLDEGGGIGVVSDDRRVRTVADGLGATVTGTVGVIVRAVEERDLTAETGKALVRRVDSQGLHMTGELRDKAYELVEDAAKNE
jgi:predicted nucleic acid-binding protein